MITLSLFIDYFRMGMDYKRNKMSTDRENGNIIMGKSDERNPRHGKRKHHIVHKLSRLN
jgi:hypothetical protein